jgi:pimeloyl-ACP methyl ester carboxylesterase
VLQQEGLDVPFMQLIWADDSRGIYASLGSKGSINVQRIGMDGNVTQVTDGAHTVTLNAVSGSTGVGVYSDPDTTPNVVSIDQAYPGRVDYDDLMAGVDEVIGRGYIDEDRLYVTGCSGGGALTAWVIGHTGRFAAAAPLCAVTDWIGMAGTADVAGWANDQFDPPYWEDPTKWLAHSPLMHVGKVTTPTLLITGDKDLRTPLAQAEAYYAALKRRGVPALLIPMVNEWHGTWSIPSNMLCTQLFLRKWFEEHGGGAKPEAEEAD